MILSDHNERLDDAASANWMLEHTGGGCWWLRAYLTDRDWEGPYMAITPGDGPERADFVDLDHDEFLLGYYRGGDDEGSCISLQASELIAAIRMIATAFSRRLPDPHPNDALSFDEVEALGADGTLRSIR